MNVPRIIRAFVALPFAAPLFLLSCLLPDGWLSRWLQDAGWRLTGLGEDE